MEASLLYRMASDCGDVRGMSNLWVLLEKRAEGLEVDVVESVRMAAHRGNAGTISTMGVLLARRAERVQVNALEAMRM